MRFHTASDAMIRRGETTDLYFATTEQILRKRRLDRVSALAEVTTALLPRGWPWGVLCGAEEAVRLFEGRHVDLFTLPEGTLFRPLCLNGPRFPVATLEGPYGAYCRYETALLGLLCQATGIATSAARIRLKAPTQHILSFGVRRMHPAIAPMIDRAAYLGGCDGVSSLAGAALVGERPQGTMPHALTIMVGSQHDAFQALDAHLPKAHPRVALVDTYSDEVAETLVAAKAVPNLVGVRLDTPSSRRGNFPELIREVRWTLDYHGFNQVKIYVSGGLDEENLDPILAAGVDGLGIGTNLSNAPTINFALDIVERAGAPAAKRGKFTGRKALFRCPACFWGMARKPGEAGGKCTRCGETLEPALVQRLRRGRRVGRPESAKRIRARVLAQLDLLRESEKAKAP